MTSCYREEILTFENPIFPDVPVSYLLTMEGSPRREQYMSQLRTFCLTRTVVVVHNKGFDKCSKPQWVDDTAMDLWHANRNVFEQAKLHDFAFVLEDDVEFLDELRNSRHLPATLRRLGGDAMFLGTIVQIGYPVEKSVFRLRSGGGMHAVLYTKQGMQNALNIFPQRSTNHDKVFTKLLTCFAPKKPLAVQKRIKTANTLEWTTFGFKIGGDYTLWLSRILGANRDPTLLFTLSHMYGMMGSFYALLLAICLAFFILHVGAAGPPVLREGETP
jgi:hypothetical protein